MRAAFRALDTTVGQDAQFSVQFSGAALQVFRGAANGQDGFTQLPDRSVGLLRRDGHLIGEGAQLIHGEAKGRHGVSRQVGCVCQIQTACLRQGQHLRQRRAGLVRVITGQSQVVQCLCCFRRGVAC